MNRVATGTILEALDPTLRPVVVVTVLLDPTGAVDILASDRDHGEALAHAARQLVAITPEVRIPVLGTVLRELLSQGEVRAAGGAT